MDTRNSGNKGKLGEILLQYRLITQAQLDEVLGEQHRIKKRLGQILLDRGWVTEEDINYVLGQQLGIPYVNLTRDMVDPDLLHRMDIAMMEHYLAIPLVRDRNKLTLAMVDPTDQEALDDWAGATKCEIIPALAKSSMVRSILDSLMSPGPDYFFDVPESFKNELYDAIRDQVTEIHFEPSLVDVKVRYRINGKLASQPSIGWAEYQDILNHFKVLETSGDMDARENSSSRFLRDGIEYVVIHSFLPDWPGTYLTLRLYRLKPVSLLEAVTGFETAQFDLMNQIIASDKPGIIHISGSETDTRIRLAYSIVKLFDPEELRICTLEPGATYSHPAYTQIYYRSGTQCLKRIQQFSQIGTDVMLADLSGYPAAIRNIKDYLYPGIWTILVTHGALSEKETREHNNEINGIPVKAIIRLLDNQIQIEVIEP